MSGGKSSSRPATAITNHQLQVRGCTVQALCQNTLSVMIQILFSKNSQQGILDVLSGVSDAAFARADILSDMEYAGLINASDFKCVTAVSLPYLHSIFVHFMHALLLRHGV